MYVSYDRVARSFESIESRVCFYIFPDCEAECRFGEAGAGGLKERIMIIIITPPLSS